MFFFLSSELWDPFCFAARRVVRNANNEKRELQVGLRRAERQWKDGVGWKITCSIFFLGRP